VVSSGRLSIPDVEAMAFLERLYATAHDDGLDILAVATGGLDAAHVQELMDRYRKYTRFPRFRLRRTRRASRQTLRGERSDAPGVLVGADGVVVYETTGFSDNQAAALAGKIESVLRAAGKSLPAFGASTERSLAPAAPDEAPSIRQKQEHEDAIAPTSARAITTTTTGTGTKPSRSNCGDRTDSRQVSVVARVAQTYERLDDPAKARAMWSGFSPCRPTTRSPETLQKLGPEKQGCPVGPAFYGPVPGNF